MQLAGKFSVSHLEHIKAQLTYQLFWLCPSINFTIIHGDSADDLVFGLANICQPVS